MKAVIEAISGGAGLLVWVWSLSFVRPFFGDKIEAIGGMVTLFTAITMALVAYVSAKWLLHKINGSDADW